MKEKDINSIFSDFLGEFSGADGTESSSIALYEDVDFSEFKGDLKKNLKSIKKKQDKFKKKRVVKPLNKKFDIRHRATIEGNSRKKISKVIAPDDYNVIIQGVEDFALTNDPKLNSIKNIGYYEGRKLKQVVFYIDNTQSAVDFNLELFNTSMPMDYLQSTGLNLNDKIIVSGSSDVKYTDVLLNFVANPALFVNAKFVFNGLDQSLITKQLDETLFFKNKRSDAYEKVVPMSVNLDAYQFQKNTVFFNMHEELNRPYVPDGMDVIQYKVYAGCTAELIFYYEQHSLKKFFIKEAKASKLLM